MLTFTFLFDLKEARIKNHCNYSAYWFHANGNENGNGYCMAFVNCENVCFINRLMGNQNIRKRKFFVDHLESKFYEFFELNENEWKKKQFNKLMLKSLLILFLERYTDRIPANNRAWLAFIWYPMDTIQISISQ